MGVRELKSFFNYQAVVDPNPQFIVDQIKSLASAYLEDEEIASIQECYEYARSCHEGQVRQSWEYYISHIVQATLFLMIINPDVETIKGCLLHDVIEDCNITAAEIKAKFGETVMKLCEGVTKVSGLKYRGEERQVETIKKTFFAMSEDLRVIFIKLADRVHNIQTLHFHPKPEKQQRIAKETLEIYIPIAEKLWLYQFQYLLENGCFRILHPVECDQIIHYLDKPIFYKSAEKGVQILTKLLYKDGLQDFEVKWRLKSPYSIHKKLKEKIKVSEVGQSINQINDLLAFRIVMDSVPNCYLTMGIIHNAYTPLVHKIKDYIVVPKPNGYQSIHSIILGLFDFPVEIQIRTKEMDRYAEFGVAAHFAYKEAGYTSKARTVRVDSKQSQRVTKLQEIVKSYQDDNEGFKKEMKIELLDDNIFLYTPKWDIIELKKWSTVLDFAFRIHGEVGLRFKNALVNGSIVPIDFEPKTGDIISINTWKNQYSAKSTWMDALKTSWARNQLSKYLRTFLKEEILKKSIDNLNTRLTDSKLPLFKSEGCQIISLYNTQEELESKLIELLDKWGYGSFINQVYKTKLKPKPNQEILFKGGIPIKTATEEENRKAVIDGQVGLDYVLCPECKNMTTNIIAKSWKNIIKIHHIGCKALNSVGYDKLFSATRNIEEKTTYHFQLKMRITNKFGNLGTILEMVSKYNLNIKTISFLDTNKDFSEGIITLELTNPSKVAYVVKELLKYPTIVQLVDKRFV